MEFKTHCLGSGLILVSIEGFVTPTFSVGEREREMEGGKRAEAGPSSQTIGGDANQASDPKPVEICTDNDDDGADPPDCGSFGKFIPSPLVPLKDQIEKDKEDESLRRWKEKLLGCVEGDLNGKMEPDVIFRSIGIISDDFGEISTPIPVDESKSDQIHFTLKEGSEYRLKLSFTVLHNIVSGLTYMNTVWKGGLQVDQSRGMLGTFAPQLEPYIHTLDEETTPSGVLARGTYAAKLKFEDDDRRCHMELNYSFEIKKGS